MKTKLIFIGLMLAIIACKPPVTEINPLSIIPLPVSVEKKSGFFLLDSLSVIECKDSGSQDIAKYFWNKLKTERGLNTESICRNNNDTGFSKISLSIDSTISMKEGYKLVVNPSKVNLTGHDRAGLFYGIQTFLQLIPTKYGEKIGRNKSFQIPLVSINDFPRFPWRGSLLDVSRHFFSFDSLKIFIDIMAMHKLNVFQLHLTDDQGWRIEIKKYPKLTEIGSWRVNRENQPWDKWSPITKDEKASYGGYYTQDQIRELVKYAQERFITIIPEIEMPAHAMAALAAYPELSCTGAKLPVVPGGVWPITHIYCAGNDNTFKLLEDVLSEVIELFPSQFIHIGGDEATKIDWAKCSKCQMRIKTEGLKNIEELQSYFIKRIEKFIVSKNRRLIGWDEILEGGLPPEATVMSWRGINGGITAAKQNHFVVMTPTDFLYLDYYQATSGEPLAIGGFLPLEKVYNYEPLPIELDANQKHFILGAQANLWTEYIHDFRHLEYMMLPRICALAELAWSQQSSRNYRGFIHRMSEHYNRLEMLNINYRQPDIIGMQTKIRFDGQIKTDFISPRSEWELHFTMDDSEPASGSAKYISPITISKSCKLSVRPFMNGMAKGRTQKAEYIKLEYIEGSKTIPSKPGLVFNCYRGDFNQVSQLDTAKSIFSGISDSLGIPMDNKAKSSVIVLSGYIKVEKDGLYRLQLNNDGWSNLFINKELLIDHGNSSEREVDGLIKLRNGYHSFRLIYFAEENLKAPELQIQLGSQKMKNILPGSFFR